MSHTRSTLYYYAYCSPTVASVCSGCLFSCVILLFALIVNEVFVSDQFPTVCFLKHHLQLEWVFIFCCVFLYCTLLKAPSISTRPVISTLGNCFLFLLLRAHSCLIKMHLSRRRSLPELIFNRVKSADVECKKNINSSALF